MGYLEGHALPGSFLLIGGLWWSTKSNLKYACKKYKWTSYPDSKSLLHRLEFFEGIIIIIMALTGMVAEQFNRGGPYLTLYDYKEGHWNQLHVWQHCTLYFFMGLIGMTNVLCFTISSLPVSITRIMLSNALFMEAFVFYNHTHGREMLDIYVHQLLVLIVIVTGLLAFMEFFMRSNVVLELLRSSFIMLQGSWFWQIGFVLSSPSGSLGWDKRDHDNMMFITICFCWHYAVTLLVVGLNYAFVTWFVKSKLKRFSSSEIGLLKNAEQGQESEEEI